MKRAIAFAAIAGLSCAAQQAHACSPPDDFIKPSNYELVQMADAIVVATPVNDVKSEFYTTVSFAVEDVIKGQPIATFESIASLGEVRDPASVDPKGPEGWSVDPNNLQTWAIDPDRCERTTFAKGNKYVIFLERAEDGSYSRLNMFASRTDEDYLGADSLWVRTIKTYLAIQSAHAPLEQLDVLEKLYEKKRKRSLTPTTIEEARDILRHLTQRTPWKPTPYLLATYDALERGEQPKYGLDVVAVDRRGRVIDRVTGKVLKIPADTFELRVEAEKTKVLRSLALGDHASAAPLFEPIAASANPAPGKLGIAIRFFAKNNQLRRAFTLVEAKAANMLAVVSQDEAQLLMRDVQAALRGDERFAFGRERWRSDPYVAQNWPELALRLYWQAFHLAIDLWPDGAIRDIDIKNYRDRPDVTRALAARHDAKARAWAIAELDDEAKRAAWEAIPWEERLVRDDPAALPMAAVVLDFGDDVDAALHKTACQGGDRRRLLIKTVGEFGDFLDSKFLGRIAMMPTLDDDEREVLGVALAQLFVRDDSRSYFATEYKMLKQAIRREPMVHIDEKLPPLECSAPTASLSDR